MGESKEDSPPSSHSPGSLTSLTVRLVRFEIDSALEGVPHSASQPTALGQTLQYRLGSLEPSSIPSPNPNSLEKDEDQVVTDENELMKGLCSLHIPNTLEKKLKSGFHRLQAFYIAKLEVSFEFTDETFYLVLPQNLGSLTLWDVECKDLNAMTRNLPATLKTLSIHNSTDSPLKGPLSPLPEGLTRLDLGRCDFKDPSWTSKLPTSLLHLRTTSVFTIVSHLRKLPKHLLSLELTRALGSGETTDIASLPRCLQMLHTPYFGDLLPGSAAPLFPPNLTSLQLAARWGPENVQQLPKTLRFLRIPKLAASTTTESGINRAKALLSRIRSKA
jgi:hypothetical protein